MERLLSLYISEPRMEELRQITVKILRVSGAKCGLLMDAAGHLLIRKGFTLIRNIEDLCVLIAASRATTHAIAEILGQKDISVIFHQGMGDHIYSLDVGERGILTVIFDDRADLAELQRVATEEAPIMSRLLEYEDPDNSHAEVIQNLVPQVDKKLDALFLTGGGLDPDALAGRGEDARQDSPNGPDEAH